MKGNTALGGKATPYGICDDAFDDPVMTYLTTWMGLLKICVEDVTTDMIHTIIRILLRISRTMHF